MDGIGIAGSGLAGSGFLSRLNSAGIPAIAYGLNRTDGTKSALDASAFASGLRILILLPRDIAEAEALLFEHEAFGSRAASVETIVIATTLSPRYVRALRGRISAAVALIDAPFSGGPRAIEKGQVSFFLGGRREDVDRLAPLFSILGQQVVRMGGFGSAMAAKVLNDFLAATSTAMTRIALDWAEAQGIDEARLLEMTGPSLVNSLLAPGYDMANFGAAGNSADETVTALVKDVEMALDTALSGAHLTPPRALEQLFRTMKSRALH